MQTLTTLKDKGQESLNHLIELGNQQPEEVRTWGLTAGAAVVGALAVAAAAKGVLAVLATLANPPVALTAGAVAGGVLGWSFMQKQHPAAVPSVPSDDLTAEATIETAATSAA